MAGRFITFEGIDGAGKSTQIDRLETLVEASGRVVCRTREPGGTPVGEKIRGILLAEDMTPETETLLFFAARAEHAARKIRPALERGEWVISDRFTDATYAYQVGGKGMSGERGEALARWTLGGFEPDLTVLCDISPAAAARRLAARAGAEDRFEAMGEDFFAKVRAASLERARRRPERFLIVNAELAPELVFDAILRKVSPWL